jgi:hypothetical protein
MSHRRQPFKTFREVHNTLYDRKDLLSKRQEILTAFGVTVATPEEILASLEDLLSGP